MFRWLLFVLNAVAIIVLAGCDAALHAPSTPPVNHEPSHGPVYATCEDAHKAGVYDIPKGDPAYWVGGDRDHDGWACDAPVAPY